MSISHINIWLWYMCVCVCVCVLFGIYFIILEGYLKKQKVEKQNCCCVYLQFEADRHHQ